MANARPKTALELVELVEQLLLGLPQAERLNFWKVITLHPDNSEALEILNHGLKACERARNGIESMRVLANSIVDELAGQLAKHRKPAKNTERDLAIMALHFAGRTSGEIVHDLSKEYDLTPSRVTAAISRMKKLIRRTEASV